MNTRMTVLTLKSGEPINRKALAYAMGLEEPSSKEVQIIVRGGLVEAIHNWPEGLPGAVYDYDNGGVGDRVRCPVKELVKDSGDTNHVTINSETLDWLIAKAMNR